MNIEKERAELKLLREKFYTENKEVYSQTNSNPDVLYLVTDPLPPIFSSQLCYTFSPDQYQTWTVSCGAPLMMNI